ncbi:MAG: hypothetical protein A3G34_00520 [Candidatus Lindowbacteria bacterium RIFCSPLOWO2_12_FULL_62_27]|nr:MAG: hypothetical protein A3G34_00520 [Candidatus Lindowbacteria bacterium RIFCSPLOWO2_12_FULL_62_27]OGH58201.1 MAG: hypothetical protein A3I06_01035 [Candidatus Lindowbacteria bacterium RIFCSPLOWO2_02_FULL_62_12]
MVLPKNGAFNWSTAEEARMRMTEYIRSHFSGLLGEDIKLLDLPNGLDLIQDHVTCRLAEHGILSNRAQAAA